MVKKLIVLIVIACGILYPYCWNRVVDKGYDWPIYIRAARGEVCNDYNTGAFVYNAKARHLFSGVALLPDEAGFQIFYLLSVAAFLGLLWRLRAVYRAYPVGAIAVGLVGGGAMFIVLRCGNISGLLAFACLNPVGAVLAGCVKPHLLGFVAVHAALFCRRHRLAQALEIPVAESQPDLPGAAGDPAR